MLKKFLYTVALISLGLLVYNIYDYFHFISARNTVVHQKGLATTANLRDQVDDLLKKIVTEGERLASEFGSRDLTAEQVEYIIKESALSIPEIQGVTACYEPNTFSDSRRLYCPYYNKGSQEYIRVGDSYDYSIAGAKGTGWYTSVRENGAKWVEPYYAQAAKDWYIDYGIPFYFTEGENKGNVKGTITMSFVASGFEKIVHDLSLGKTGYGIISSAKGMMLSHPIAEYIGTRNLKEQIEEEVEPKLIEAYQGMLKGEVGNTTFYDENLKDNTLFYYDKIPTSGWSMGVMFYKNDLLGDQTKLSRKYIVMSLLLSVFFLFLIAIYYNRDYLDRSEIWQLSILASILLIANVFLVGYLQHNTMRLGSSEDSPPIVDMSGLASFVNGVNARADQLKLKEPTPIPTGIFIKRMEFQDSYNLNIGGNLWQKYPLDISEDIDFGFSFPQMSPFAEAAYAEESYRDTILANEGEEGYLLVGYEFRSTLRLNLKYDDYPFDKRQLNIEIEPKRKKDNLIFIPDLASYKYTNPSMKSGLSNKIELSGNELLESYFNYTTETFDSDFGYGDKSLFEEVPTLHYNVHLKRILLNAFVTYLIPIFVVLMMLFILIFACGKTEERQGIIESMAAFFFVLIFSHIDLRKEVVTADLIYMEYFYFITYFMIVLSTINLITYAKNKSKIFDHNENQIYKAVYFPAFLFMLLIITLVKFY